MSVASFPISVFLEGPAVSARLIALFCSDIVYRTAKQSLSQAGASTQWAVNPWSFTRQYRIFISYQGHIGSSVIRRITHATNRPQWRMTRSLRRVALITSRPKFKLQAPDQRKKAVPQSSPWLPHTFLENSSSKFSIFNKEKKHEWSGELKQGSAQEKSYS